MAEPPGVVARPRLVALIESQPSARLVTMIAPPGYGKTTVLAQLAARGKRRVAWLTCDDLDNDPTVLMTYVAAALDALGPVGSSVSAALTGASRRDIGTAVSRLAAQLREWDGGALLVIDDAHRLVHAGAVDALEAFIDLLPAEFTVVVAGRTAPALPIARYRVQRALVEIDASDLAFDERETADLARATGWAIGPAEARELAASTEGWAAAIYLASLGHVRNPDVGTPTSVPDGDRFITEYLQAEVHDHLSEEELELLTRTSILDTVTPALANAVSGMADASARLPGLATRNLLIQRLSGAPQGYRYHNLLRGFLRSELERREADASREYHRRAAEWYAGAGTNERAVEHLLAAGDEEQAAELLAAISLPLFFRGNSTTAGRLLGRFGREALHRTPSLAATGAWLFLMSGHPDEAFVMADIAESADPGGPSHDGAANFGSELAMLRAVMARHGPKQVMADARRAVSLEPGNSPWRSKSLWLLAWGYRMAGDLESADATFSDAIDAGVDGGPNVMVSLAARAAIAIERADWPEARRFIAASEARRVAFGSDSCVISLVVDALSARLSAHEGDHAAARAHLANAQLARPTANQAIPWFSVDALLELARAYLAISDLAGAQQAVREAEQIVRRRPALGSVTDDLLAMRIRLEGAATALAGSSSLTTAELRVMQLLPTYLSFQEIGDRLLVSRNTVKTHAMAIYGKLWASSRGEAVERAVELGLLEPYPLLQDWHPAEDLGHASD